MLSKLEISFVILTQCEIRGVGKVMLAYHVWMDEDTKNESKVRLQQTSFLLALESHSSHDD